MSLKRTEYILDNMTQLPESEVRDILRGIVYDLGEYYATPESEFRLKEWPEDLVGHLFHLVSKHKDEKRTSFSGFVNKLFMPGYARSHGSEDYIAE